MAIRMVIFLEVMHRNLTAPFPSLIVEIEDLALPLFGLSHSFLINALAYSMGLKGFRLFDGP